MDCLIGQLQKGQVIANQVKNFLIAIVVVITSGCSLLPVKQNTVYVDVPTPVSCVTWEPDAPLSAFAVLPETETLTEHVRALLIDREADSIYITGLKSVIEGCKSVPKTSK